MYDDLITEVRELCEYSEKIVNQLHTERLDYELEYMPLIETIQVTSELCDALVAMTARAEKAEAENRWIPVSERLPEVPLFEQADDDWITDRGYPFLVTYDYGDVGIESFWSKTGFSDCKAPVTHWRPIPEPPKGV